MTDPTLQGPLWTAITQGLTLLAVLSAPFIIGTIIDRRKTR